MDHAVGVGAVERGGDVAGDTRHLRARHELADGGVFFDNLAEVAPLDQDHRHVIQVIDIAKLVDADDIGMAKARNCAGFAQEAVAIIFMIHVAHQMRANDFDGGIAIQPCIVTTIHRCHAAASNDANDSVIAKLASDERIRDCHRAFLSCGSTDLIITTNLV